MLAMFDVPDPNAHSAKRVETTTPLQKMFVLNSPFMVRQATALAKRCIASGESNGKRIAWVYQLIYGRDADEREIALGRAFLNQPTHSTQENWERYVQVLLASNEVLFVD